MTIVLELAPEAVSSNYHQHCLKRQGFFQEPCGLVTKRYCTSKYLRDEIRQLFEQAMNQPGTVCLNIHTKSDNTIHGLCTPTGWARQEGQEYLICSQRELGFKKFALSDIRSVY